MSFLFPFGRVWLNKPLHHVPAAEKEGTSENAMVRQIVIWFIGFALLLNLLFLSLFCWQ